MRYSQSGLVINGVTGYAYGGAPVTVNGLTPGGLVTASGPSRTQSKNARKIAELTKRLTRLDKSLASLPVLPTPEPEPVDPRPIVKWTGAGRRHEPAQPGPMRRANVVMTENQRETEQARQAGGNVGLWSGTRRQHSWQ